MNSVHQLNKAHFQPLQR